jgi:hypothetical protein
LRPAPDPALGKKHKTLDDCGSPPGVPGHQIEMPLHLRIVDFAAKDLDRHENRRERMAYLVDHFAGVEAGWEGAEGRL